MIAILSGFSFSQTKTIDVAFNTSIFENRANANRQITPIENPLAMGFQLKYHFQPGIAVKLANESLKGSVQNNSGEGLNVQTSVSVLLYPVTVWKFSPYINFGLSMSRYHDASNLKSKDDLFVMNGLGTDFSLIGSLLLSTEANFYTDGLNYVGWGSTFGLGYRF